MSSESQSLAHEEFGPYVEMVSRPNPHGFVIAFMPALGALLQRAEKQRGTELSATEVVRIRDAAPSIALLPEQAQAMREERGYDDVEPSRVYESWREFKRDL